MAAYEDMIRATATSHAPWYVVPADNKWLPRLVVAGAIVDALAELGLRYPDVGPDKKKELAAARDELLGENKAAKRAKRAAERAASGARPLADTPKAERGAA